MNTEVQADLARQVLVCTGVTGRARGEQQNGAVSLALFSFNSGERFSRADGTKRRSAKEIVNPSPLRSDHDRQSEPIPMGRSQGAARRGDRMRWPRIARHGQRQPARFLPPRLGSTERIRSLVAGGSDQEPARGPGQLPGQGLGASPFAWVAAAAIPDSPFAGNPIFRPNSIQIGNSNWRRIQYAPLRIPRVRSPGGYDRCASPVRMRE
jgi:hypothetical protein